MSDFLKNLAKNEAKSISERLSSETKRELYRIFQKEEVSKDMEALITNIPDYILSNEDKAEIINNASNRYVYDLDYDCKLSYWENIETLTNEELDKIIDSKEREGFEMED